MNLHAISYFNIGPFRDRTINIFFRQGKFLIKAPVGSGKSFLFFDGPMYGLYKYGTRNVLNIQSKTGFIKLWFEVNGQHYLVVRNLKKGKSKDSCSSMLYSLEGNPLDNMEIPAILDGLNDNQNIEDFVNKKSQLEEINFKNETDLQQNLSDLLPPREVFQSTIFLMQDADNIFELLPSERLNVLKNVFGLLGIDDAKNIIIDRKRSIQTELRVKGDSTQYDIKLKQFLGKYLENAEKLKKEKYFEACFSVQDSFFNNIKNIADKLNINDFSVQDFPTILHQELHKLIEEKKASQQKIRHEYGIYENQLKELDSSQNNIEKESIDKKNLLTELENKIKTVDPEKLNKLKTEKENIWKEQELLENVLEKDEINNFWGNYSESKIFEDWTNSFPENINLSWTNLLIDNCSQQGKIIKELGNTIESKRKNIEQQEKHFSEQISQLEIKEGTDSFGRFEKECKHFEEDSLNKIQRIENEIIVLEEKYKNRKEQLNKLNKNLEEFSAQIDEQANFHCDKIETSCPFIKQINKKTFEQLESQRKKMEEEKSLLEKVLKEENIEDKIKVLKEEKVKNEKILEEFKIEPKKFLGEFLEELKTKKINIEKKIGENDFIKEKEKLTKEEAKYGELLKVLTNFLTKIKWRDVKENYKKNVELEKIKRNKDEEIMKMEKNMKELENYKLEKEKTNVELMSLQKNLDANILKQKDLKIQIDNFESILKSDEFLLINEWEQNYKEMEQSFVSLKHLASDYEEIKIQLKQLKEDEKIINNLYHIFSKELLLIVLEDSLPTLSEIINNFLAQVVDYQINFFLSKSSSDKLELEAKIYDEKGERDVKSLSGGQRIILKLVWMLAISSYMRSPMLFLDETINNLDQDSVGKVADMLSNFVKQRDVKLYTITHSQQIQEMDIWDEVLKIT